MNRSPRRRLHFDGHIMPDATMLEGFDPVKFVAAAVATGADSFCVHTKCHYGYSYYPTEIGHMHPALHGYDLAGTLCREFKRQAPECRMFAYYTLLFSPIDSDLHPDWCADAGKVEEAHVKNEWRVMCFNSPYRDVVFGQLKELTERYPFDGVFLDFSRSPGLCRCRYCQEKYGREIDPESPEYCRWKQRDSDRFIEELAGHLGKRISLASNYCYGVRQPLPVPPMIGFLTADVCERREAPGVQESYHARYFSTLDAPAELMTTNRNYWWTDWSIRAVDVLKAKNAIISMLGVGVNLADIPYPDYRVKTRELADFQQVFEQSRTIDAVLDGARSAPDVLLFHGAENYYHRPRPENDDWEALLPLEGMHNLLVQSCLHHQIVSEHNLAQWLPRSPVIVIADQPFLAGDVLDRLERSDAMVLAIGSTLENPRIQRLCGLTGVEKSTMPFAFFDTPEVPLIVRGNPYFATPAGAETLIMMREGFFSQFDFYTGAPVGEVRYPALTRRGRFFALLLPVALSAREWMMPELKRYFEALLLRYSPRPYCLAKSHSRVEVTHSRRGNTDLVGLVGHACDLMMGNHYVPGTVEPVHALELQFRYEQAPREVKDAPWSWDAGVLTVRVPDFHICRFLEIENE